MAHILMVDDNPQNQRYIERIIRHRTSHQLTFAGHGEEVIEKIVERRPDIILLDLFIPGVDGFDLFNILRDHPATRSIPIIIHTAIPFDQVTQIRLRRVQHDGLIEFPIEASEFARIIDIALKRNSPTERKWVPPSIDPP